jgi:hypothetical protein
MQSSPAGPSFPACSEEFEAAAEREVAELLHYAAAEGGEAADVRRGCGDGEAAGGGVESAGPRRAAGPDLPNSYTPFPSPPPRWLIVCHG